MINRHEWTSQDIITAYHGHSKIEYAFRNMKNPYHLALKLQYHWADQKIKDQWRIAVDISIINAYEGMRLSSCNCS